MSRKLLIQKLDTIKVVMTPLARTPIRTVGVNSAAKKGFGTSFKHDKMAMIAVAKQ